MDILYADDMTYATTEKSARETIKEEIPAKLKKYNLGVNISKTEESEAPDNKIPSPPPPPKKNPENTTTWSDLDWLLPPPPSKNNKEPSWTNTKLLGSKLGTKQDINSRKSKVWEPIKNNTIYFKSKNISIEHKMRLFNTYVGTIFLYNSELWTLTKVLENNIDSFHRRLLRIAINDKYIPAQQEQNPISWSDLDWTINTKKAGVLPNNKLYEITQQEPWSKTIQRRRIRLLGHILRLHPETPAQLALAEITKPQKRCKGRPKLTWINLLLKDLTTTREQHNISNTFDQTTYSKSKALAENREARQSETGRSMECKL